MKVNINAKSIKKSFVADTININQTLPSPHSNVPDSKLPEDNLRELVIEHENRLQKLKVQQAKQGISTDPSIIIEIENIEVTLESLYAQLEELKKP